MDHTAIRFLRWSWIAGILLLERGAGERTDARGAAVPGMQPPRRGCTAWSTIRRTHFKTR